MSGEHRFSDAVDRAVYHVVSEALANAAKHADASLVRVELQSQDAVVQVAVRDDGVGGADPGRGSGLMGLTDRVEAVGGKLEIVSPAGGGTSLQVTIPLEPVPREAG
jgi:signal transduction histidine kinase